MAFSSKPEAVHNLIDTGLIGILCFRTTDSCNKIEGPREQILSNLKFAVKENEREGEAHLGNIRKIKASYQVHLH